jgi:hypothetical protein
VIDGGQERPNKINLDATAAHHGQLVGPESVPMQVISGGRHARIKLHSLKNPSPCGADGLGKLLYVVVRVGIAESVPGVMEQVLPIEIAAKVWRRTCGVRPVSSKV